MREYFTKKKKESWLLFERNIKFRGSDGRRPKLGFTMTCSANTFLSVHCLSRVVRDLLGSFPAAMIQNSKMSKEPGLVHRRGLVINQCSH